MKHSSLWLIYHVKIPIPKLFPQPIITRENSAMNQSEFLAIARNLFKAREKLRMQGVIGFGFDFHWLKKSGTRFLSQSLSVVLANM